MTDQERQQLIILLENYKGYDRELNKLVHDAADEIERLAALVQSKAEPVRAFTKAVLHGDDEHKAWLIEAAEAFIAGNPLPAPRGKGTQSNADPVAWQTRAKGSEDWFWHHHGEGKPDIDPEFYEARPLYTAPPRPDASAGLIEAAEELCDLMDDVVQGNYKPDTFTTQPLRKALRGRAADLEAKIDNLERRTPW